MKNYLSMKRIFYCLLLLMLFTYAAAANAANGVGQNKVVVAYVTSWSKVLPNPMLMTHINYAFGHVNDTFDGVRIDNEQRLRQLVTLKQKNSNLHVLLSIGGWGSGRFSEMAADENRRLSFAKDCKRVVTEFGLDGIDIDWEYPTQSSAGISSSPDDTKNFTLLMRDLRKSLGKKKELTLASIASAEFIDFHSIIKYVDFVNVMSYDMGRGSKHHAALYPSEISGGMTSSEAVEAHLEAGVPAKKLVMGMPFYGRGVKNVVGDFNDYRDIISKTQFKEKWDDKGKVPYLVNDNDEVVLGFDNPRSLGLKCDYINERGLHGGMYWDYAGDTDDEVLAKTVCEKILGNVRNQ